MKYLGLLPLLLVLAACKPASVKPADATPAPSPAAADAGRPGGPSGGPGGPGGGPGGGGPGARLDRMKTELALSDEQSKQIEAVFEEQRPAMQALRDDASMSREDRREKMREIRQSADAKIAAILTPEQKAKWEEQRANRQREGGPGGGPGAPGGKHKKDGGAGGGPGAGGPGGPEAAGAGAPPPPPMGE